MKTTRFYPMARLHVALVLTFLMPFSYLSCAAVPQPAVVYYGLARDPYGWPYFAQNKATITLLINGVAHDSYPVDGFIAPNVNFRFVLTVGDATPVGIYEIPSVHTGAQVAFAIQADRTNYPVLQAASIPVVPKAGGLVAVDLTAGHDADNDGLPDEWERDLIEHSAGAFQSIYEVRPADDYDGDGYSNRAEYDSGTIPYWDFDYLYIEKMAMAWGPYLGFSFITVPGIAYGVRGTPNVSDPAAWKNVEYQMGLEAAPQTALFIGSGYLTTIYIPATNAAAAITIESR